MTTGTNTLVFDLHPESPHRKAFDDYFPPQSDASRLERVQELELILEVLTAEEGRLHDQIWALHRQKQEPPSEQFDKYRRLSKLTVKLLRELHGYSEFSS